MSWIPGTRSTQRSQHTTYAVVIPVAQYKIGHTARGWVGRFAAGAVAGVATVAFALVLPGSGLAQTVTFGVGGATWTVPPGVHFISAAATGASGGYDGAVPSACTPGKGQTLTASDLPVTPGQQISIEVGSQGGNGAGGAGGAGGNPGGGAGGAAASGDEVGGGGGGGYTIVAPAGFAWYADAAGGGGCGGLAGISGGNGGDASADGAAGSGGPNGAAGGGLGGRHGGTGGADVPADSHQGEAGSQNHGGAGYGSTLYAAGGGGGGGGLAGGGGGGAAADQNGSAGGGGGGGSYSENTIGVTWDYGIATTIGDGAVTISYTPPPAPSVSTGSATEVTDVGATVVGTVNPNGVPTTYHFDYGATPAYGEQSPDGSAGSGSGPAPVSVALSGLAPGTVYHYRLVATNFGGTTYGQDQRLTSVAPPAAATNGPTAVRDTAATIAGTVNPYGLATTYFFEYGTTQSYGARTASVSAGSTSQPQTVSADISGLQPATVYHYRLIASRGADETDGADQTLRTPGPPTARTDLASDVTQTASLVSGKLNPDGHQTTYHFEYGPSTAYGHQTIEVAAGSGLSDVAVSQELGGLQPGVRYHYRIVATSESGVANGLDATFVTASPPPISHISFVGKPAVHGASVVYTLSCAAAPCQVTAILTSPSGVKIGSRTLTIVPGQRHRLTLSLNATGRRLERRLKHLRATLKLWSTSGGGHMQPLKTVPVSFIAP